MRIVDRPVVIPNRCAVLPHLTLSGAPRMRWVDTGAEMVSSGHDQRVYVSEAGVKELAKLFGYIAPTDAQALRAERDAASRELEATQAEVVRLTDVLSALTKAGFEEAVA